MTTARDVIARAIYPDWFGQEGCPLCGCPIGRHPLRDPHKKYEALLAAAKLFYKYRHIFFDHMSIHQSRTEIMPALDALRAAGIEIEE